MPHGTEKEKDKFLATIRENRRIAAEGSREIYDAFLHDMKFVYNVDNCQWPNGLSSDVKLTANELLKSLEQIRADVYQNQPRLKVVPVDDFADVEKAELINDLMRQDDHLSNAVDVRMNALTHALAGGIGYYRLITKRMDPMSFDQNLILQRIRNPHTILFDPAAREFNREDAKFCFIDGWMKRKDFKVKYPTAGAADIDAGNRGQAFEGWFEKDKIRLSEYYHKAQVPFTLARVRRVFGDGRVGVRDMELTDEVREFIKDTRSEIIAEEESFKIEVKWALVTATDVLEETDWVTDDIPIIPVQGNEVNVDGKMYLMSFHRGAHDFQRMRNFWFTQATKVMGKAPDFPYLVDDRQIEGKRREWDDPGDRRYLTYKHIQGLQKPTRERMVEPPAGMLTMVQMMTTGIEEHLGRSDPSNGAPSSERSGKAKQILINQSNKGTFIFTNNYMRAILYEGKMRLKAMPKIYDSQRAMQIRGEDGETRLRSINAPTGELDKDSVPVIENDMSIGKFDLIPALAVSTESRREEQREGLKGILQYAGDFAPAIIPAILELEDLPNQKKVLQKVEQLMEGIQDNRQSPEPAQ